MDIYEVSQYQNCNYWKVLCIAYILEIYVWDNAYKVWVKNIKEQVHNKQCQC